MSEHHHEPDAATTEPAGASADRSTIAFVGNYLPRMCGIATFTSDLCEAVAHQAPPNADVFAIALNDRPEGYAYPPRVRFEIRESLQGDYRLAADFVNIRQTSVVCLQHEYGIFGGPCGSHALTLLRHLRRPLVTTLHTVLKEPTEQELHVMQAVCKASNRVVVMSEIAHEMLHDVFDVPREKIVTVHHGIPDLPFVDPNFYKDQFGVEGKKVVLTFGLLSPNKGIEGALDAMAKVVARHPDTVYIVLGATHPHVKRDSGEEYRQGLFRRVKELGLADNVIFQNRFVELEELCEYLGAADIYVTPYLNEAQITSGTLAYALGAGKAVVSTPYWYATEMLADGRGKIVPFKDPDALANAVCELMDQETERHAMRKRAYTFCRQMIWKRVAQDYLDVFDEAREAWVASRRTSVPRLAGPQGTEKRPELPDLDLRHLRVLTDTTGIFQHATYATPDRHHGYCTDDNCRALIAACMYWDQTHDHSVIPLIQNYLSFLDYALNEETGRFRNFMNYDRTWAEDIGSQDSHARALWGLGMAVAYAPHDSMIALATQLFRKALPAAMELEYPRSWAFTIIAIHAYLRRFGGDSEARRFRAQLAEKLLEVFQQHMTDDWPWLEDTVTYANAKLPHALMMAGQWMQRGDMIDVGRQALDWLVRIQTAEDGCLSIIGNEGWYTRGGQKARFAQQPIEAHALVDACIEAYHVTREPRWIDEAYRAFNWFIGDNDLKTPVYDFTTGGCRDGMHVDRVSGNQGAESTLAWLISLLLMRELRTDLDVENPQRKSDPDYKPASRVVKTATKSLTPGSADDPARSASTSES